MDDSQPSPVTRDAFLGGRLVLDQPAKGHRSGTDAILLSAAVPRDFTGRLYDFGAGVGAVGMAIALACPSAEIVLVERDLTSLALAQRNVDSNCLNTSVKIVECNLLSRPEREQKLPGKADIIVTNPPFYRSDRVRSSPDSRRRAAHVMAPGDLADWASACFESLAPKGRLIILHQAEAVPELLALMLRCIGDVTLKSIHPREGQAAVRVLLRGQQGSRASFRIAPPLILHSGDAFTAEASALHRGVSVLDW